MNLPEKTPEIILTIPMIKHVASVCNDTTVSDDTKEKEYQLFLINLDKLGLRPLNRNSEQLLKHFPSYKQS